MTEARPSTITCSGCGKGRKAPAKAASAKFVAAFQPQFEPGKLIALSERAKHYYHVD